MTVVRRRPRTDSTTGWSLGCAGGGRGCGSTRSSRWRARSSRRAAGACGRSGTGAGDLWVEHVLVAPPAKKIEIAHHGVRVYVEKWMRRISRSGACYLGRNRKNTEAVELNSSEEIRQPGGDLGGGFGGNERGGRGLSIGSNGARFGALKRWQSIRGESARMSCSVRESRPGR